MRKKLIVTPQNIFGQNPLAFPFNLKNFNQGTTSKTGSAPMVRQQPSRRCNPEMTEEEILELEKAIRWP